MTMPSSNELQSPGPLRFIPRLLITIWLVLIVRLMVADVWDETNGMVAFSDAGQSLAAKLAFVLTHSVGFYRPLPTAFAAIFLHFVRSYTVSWRVLRGLNAAAVIAAVVLFEKALQQWNGRSVARQIVFTAAILFSGSAIITAGWFANLFDAWTLLLIAAGTLLLSRERPLAAGLMFGVAFFCKETAVLSMPLLALLLASGRITFRQTLRSAIPAVVLGGIYFAIRSRIISFGSMTDTHGFDPHLFLPTLRNWCESFWWEALKGNGGGWIGYVFLFGSVAALRRPRLIAAAILLIASGAVIYWQMIMPYQDGVLITHLNFIGRLYLIPTAILLFILALERRDAVIAVLLIPIVLGAWPTYRDHLRFQRTYKRIYRTASEAKHPPIVVDYAEKPLHDVVRGIDIGAFPNAPMSIDPKSGGLIFR